MFSAITPIIPYVYFGVTENQFRIVRLLCVCAIDSWEILLFVCVCVFVFTYLYFEAMYQFKVIVIYKQINQNKTIDF